MDLPPGTMILTVDATSMYTNIHTRPALNHMAQYFNGNKTTYRHLPVNAMLRTLRLITENNIFRFGDSHWFKLKVIAIGKSPAPTYATVFYVVF